MSKIQITTLGALRSFAVLAVCFFHISTSFRSGNALSGLMNYMYKYGDVGVQIFFVISGFIIPFSLYKSRYTINNYFIFLSKRAIRLHPPYLFALGITLVVSGISYKIRHIINPETFKSILQSLIYLHVPADNQVFWTLKIEAEYYLVIGLSYPFLIKFPKISMLLIIPIVLALSISPIKIYLDLLPNFPYFIIGIIGFLIYVKQNSRVIEYLILFSTSIFCLCFFPFYKAIVSLITILIILFIRKPIPRGIQALGEISYSVYLLHFLIGSKFINLFQRIMGYNYGIPLFTITILVCFFTGWIFWKYIEKPFTTISTSIKYKISEELYKTPALGTVLSAESIQS